MRAIAFALGVLAAALVAGCGAQPNQPVLANVPKPNTAAAAGVADNVRRLRAGEKLHDLIDPAAGY